MAVLLVTYDLKQPGRDYAPIHAFLKQFTHCKQLESVWLLDTTWTTETVRDALATLIDRNDVIFVAKLQQAWHAWGFGCSDWLLDSSRNWQ